MQADRRARREPLGACSASAVQIQGEDDADDRQERAGDVQGVVDRLCLEAAALREPVEAVEEMRAPGSRRPAVEDGEDDQ